LKLNLTHVIADETKPVHCYAANVLPTIARDRCLVPKDHRYEMAYGESNDVTLPQKGLYA